MAVAVMLNELAESVDDGKAGYGGWWPAVLYTTVSAVLCLREIEYTIVPEYSNTFLRHGSWVVDGWMDGGCGCR